MCKNCVLVFWTHNISVYGLLEVSTFIVKRSGVGILIGSKEYLVEMVIDLKSTFDEVRRRRRKKGSVNRNNSVLFCFVLLLKDQQLKGRREDFERVCHTPSSYNNNNN